MAESPFPGELFIADAFILKASATNRKLGRAMFQELEKMNPLLVKIEQNFIDNVFDSPEEYTYQRIYSYYLDRFNEWMQYCKQSIKPKYVAINENYFTQTFAPQI